MKRVSWHIPEAVGVNVWPNERTSQVIFAHVPKLVDVAAQLKRSAHAALGLATNGAQ